MQGRYSRANYDISWASNWSRLPSGPKETWNVSSPSKCESQYCGEPTWPIGRVFGLRPPGHEFRIMWLEDSVISIISPSSEVLLAQFSLYVHKGGLKPGSFHFCKPHFTQCKAHFTQEAGISGQHVGRSLACSRQFECKLSKFCSRRAASHRATHVGNKVY